MPQLYYILDARQVVGNCALWWCPNGNGYTTQIDEAGLFDEAFVSGMDRDTDHAYPQELVENLIVKHVRLDHLRGHNNERWVQGKKGAKYSPAPVEWNPGPGYSDAEDER